MTNQKNIEAKLQRLAGMEPDRREELAAINEQMEDWRGRCRTCGTMREGTLAQLRAPCGCEVANGAAS